MRTAWKLVTLIGKVLSIGLGLMVAYILLLAVRDWLRHMREQRYSPPPLLGDKQCMGSQPAALPMAKQPSTLPLDTPMVTSAPLPESPPEPPEPLPAEPPDDAEENTTTTDTETVADSDSDASAGDAEPEPSEEPLPAEPVFEGNEVVPRHWPCKQGQIKANRDSKKYHVPEGRFYARVYEGVECFDTEEEARAAGYTRSKR